MKESFTLNFVICLLILINIVGLFVVKDAWVQESPTGWTAQISKILYGVIILIMIPSILYKCKELLYMKFMVYLCLVHIIYAIFFKNINFGETSKQFLLFLSFLFFHQNFKNNNVNYKLLSIYILTQSISIIKSIIEADIFSSAIETGYAKTGQATSLILVLLLPFVCYLWKPKQVLAYVIVSFLFVLLSMRRTSILTFLICIPFIYKYVKDSLSRKFIYLIILFFALGIYYIIDNYWFIIELRFSDIFTPDRHGNLGSGISDWYVALFHDYLNNSNLLELFFGKGLGEVGVFLNKLGYEFTHAHNDYLEVVYTYGLLGLLGYYISIIYLVVSGIRKNPRYKTLIIMSLIMVLFIGAVSEIVQSPTTLTISLFLCMAKFNRGHKHTYYENINNCR